MELCVTSKLNARTPDGRPIPFAEGAALAAQAGFTQMDYGFSAAALLDDGWKQKALTDWEIAKSVGLTLRYAHLPYDYPKAEKDWPNFFKASCRAIDLACLFEVECAAIHPCTAMVRDYNRSEVREETLTFLHPYCEYAKQAGLVLALENMRGAGKSVGKSIVRYATEVNDLWDLAETLNIGICWDTGHGNISMQEQYTSIKKIEPRLKMMHFNDNFAEDDIHLAPFLGTVDWDSITEALHEIGFAGAVNLEVMCNKRPMALRKAYASYMGQAAKLLHEMLQ